MYAKIMTKIRREIEREREKKEILIERQKIY